MNFSIGEQNQTEQIQGLKAKGVEMNIKEKLTPNCTQIRSDFLRFYAWGVAGSEDVVWWPQKMKLHITYIHVEHFVSDIVIRFFVQKITYMNEVQ